MRLLYFADPMCSWCYGFGPQLQRVLDNHPEATLELTMGGLRAYNREAATPAFRDMIKGHWKHVGDASGLSFNPAALERDGFVYDTEPPCRAVVTARTIDASKAFAYFKAVQAAFYAEGRDVTQTGTLVEIADRAGYDAPSFSGMMATAGLQDETRLDFTTTQSLGVNGFPTLASAHGKQLYLVTNGYNTAEVVEQRLEEIARLAGA